MNALTEHVAYLSQQISPEALVKVARSLEQYLKTGELSFTFTEVSSPVTTTLAPEPSADTDRRDAAGDHEEEEVRALAKQRSMRGRRIAVSAEPTQRDESFKPRLIEKNPEQQQKLRQMVASCHLFASMEREEQDVIVGALEKASFPAGHEVLTQGSAPKIPMFYMILDGTCEVIKNGKPVASLGIGNVFGELEIMYASKVCEATVRTVTECVMYTLDQHNYKNIVYKVSIDKAEKYLDLVDKVSFLEPMSDYDKKSIAEALVTSRYEEGDTIIFFGEPGMWMHIVIDGTVSVFGRDRGKQKHVIDLGPGNVVGELEFLFDHPCVADVIAKTEVVTAKINRKHFEMLLGKITPELKYYVARKGNYTHYLESAGEAVRREISTIERRHVRHTAGSATIDNIDKNGEVLLHYAFPTNVSPACRFSMRMVGSTNALMIGLREDATIVYWSGGMERLTEFPAEEVIGQSFYSLLLNPRDQQELQQQLIRAIPWGGNVGDEFFADEKATQKVQYTMQRRDGLTKTTIQLAMIPPSFTHGKEVAEILLAVGQEVRSSAQQQDYTNWLTENVRSTIANLSLDGDTKLSAIGELLSKFEVLQNRALHTTASNLNTVNVRQLVGQVVMDYGQRCVAKNITVSTEFTLGAEEVFIDADVLPAAFRAAMANIVAYVQNGAVAKITVNVEEEFGAEMLVVSFRDNGPGIPAKVLEAFAGDYETYNIVKIKGKLKHIGGDMSISSEPGSTVISIRFPFLPAEDADAEEESEVIAASIRADNELAPRETYTSLVVEDRATHRNMLCAFLWNRKHAVLPAYTTQDVHRLRDQVDLLFIDPKQALFREMEDPWSTFREMSRNVAVVLTGDSFDSELHKAAQLAGFLTLSKPFSAAHASATIRKAEHTIGRIKAERERIAQSREMLKKMKHAAWNRGAQLGKGTFGSVYEAIDTLTGGRMAVKVIRLDDRKVNKEELVNEINVMCTLQHPNIIHYFFCEEDDENHVINVLMEFAGGGTLNGLLERKGQLEFTEYVNLLRDVVQGVAYIHSQRFVHCDLKTANVLLSADGKGKIGDFGTTHRLAEGEERYIPEGTFLYMSPECLSAGEVNEDTGEKIGFGFPADVWSLGCLALEMATGKPPFSYLGLNQTALVNYICSLSDIPDLSPLFEYHPHIIEFVSACLKPNPSERLTTEALLALPLFQEGSDEDVANAIKVLRRAQLRSVLERFVAFQEIDEAEAARAEEERFRNRKDDDGAIMHSPRSKFQEEEDFFNDSDEVQSEGSDDEKASSVPLRATLEGSVVRVQSQAKATGIDASMRRDARSFRKAEVSVVTGDITTRRGAADERLLRMASLASMHTNSKANISRSSEPPEGCEATVPEIMHASIVMAQSHVTDSSVEGSYRESTNVAAATTKQNPLHPDPSPEAPPLHPNTPPLTHATTPPPPDVVIASPSYGSVTPTTPEAAERRPTSPPSESTAVMAALEALAGGGATFFPMGEADDSPAPPKAPPKAPAASPPKAPRGRQSPPRGRQSPPPPRAAATTATVADGLGASKSGGGIPSIKVRGPQPPQRVPTLTRLAKTGLPAISPRPPQGPAVASKATTEKDRLVLMLHHQLLLLAEKLMENPRVSREASDSLMRQYQLQQQQSAVFAGGVTSLLQSDANFVRAMHTALQ